MQHRHSGTKKKYDNGVRWTLLNITPVAKISSRKWAKHDISFATVLGKRVARTDMQRSLPPGLRQVSIFGGAHSERWYSLKRPIGETAPIPYWEQSKSGDITQEHRVFKVSWYYRVSRFIVVDGDTFNEQAVVASAFFGALTVRILFRLLLVLHVFNLWSELS